MRKTDIHCHVLPGIDDGSQSWQESLEMLKLAAALYSLGARLTGAQPALNYDKVKEAVVPGHWICSSEKWRSLTGQQFTPLDEGLKKSF